MRLAVCLSGQLREWEACYQNQKLFWDSSHYEVDYFIHTWTYSADRTGVSKPYEFREVSEEEIEDIVDVYEPKKFLVESLKPEDHYRGDHWLSLFHSMVQSFLLKREYEIENDFQYDIVVKSRPDLVFNPVYKCRLPFSCNNMLWTTHGGPMPQEFNMINFSDCCFLGNSYTMDLLCNMYAYRKYLIHEESGDDVNPHPLGPGVLMNDFMMEFGITPDLDLPFEETIVRLGHPKVMNLYEPEEFNKIEQDYRDWYTR